MRIVGMDGFLAVLVSAFTGDHIKIVRYSLFYLYLNLYSYMCVVYFDERGDDGNRNGNGNGLYIGDGEIVGPTSIWVTFLHYTFTSFFNGSII